VATIGRRTANGPAAGPVDARRRPDRRGPVLPSGVPCRPAVSAKARPVALCCPRAGHWTGRPADPQSSAGDATARPAAGLHCRRVNAEARLAKLARHLPTAAVTDRLLRGDGRRPMTAAGRASRRGRRRLGTAETAPRPALAATWRAMRRGRGTDRPTAKAALRQAHRKRPRGPEWEGVCGRHGGRVSLDPTPSAGPVRPDLPARLVCRRLSRSCPPPAAGAADPGRCPGTVWREWSLARPPDATPHGAPRAATIAESRFLYPHVATAAVIPRRAP